MKTSSKSGGGPVLDEATFQKLLAAAYVLQEHHDQTQQAAAAEKPSSNPDADSDTSILAQIVEIQHEIQSNHLDLPRTSKLLVDRILKISGAQGAAVGIVHEDELVYQAGSGILSSQTNRSARREATLSASTLLHDIILRCTDATTDFRVNPEITKRFGIGSFIAVPVFQNGKVNGALELVFSKPDAFQDQDVRTCQLMAGLVTETLTRTAEEDWRKGLAAERASMLEVLEKIKPQLARLANTPDAALLLSNPSAAIEQSLPKDNKCHNCGAELAADEDFCGLCGASRASVSHNDLQSKWATLWNLKNATEGANVESAYGQASVLKDSQSAQPLLDPEKSADDEALATRTLPENSVLEHPATVSADGIEEGNSAVTGEAAPEATTQAENGDTPKRAEGRVWFRSIAVSPPAVQLRGFWQKSAAFIRTHRGDLALSGAFILFLITILWAISSDHPTTSADSGKAAPSTAALAKPKRKQAPPPPKLSMLEEFLVSVGLAEPPPAPSYSGNPNIPVWVDIHTALYYCPGSDLYGKTPQGKIASQHDAQIDQFEPASRKVCD
jgi:GAF domain-containing protein